MDFAELFRTLSKLPPVQQRLAIRLLLMLSKDYGDYSPSLRELRSTKWTPKGKLKPVDKKYTISYDRTYLRKSGLLDALQEAGIISLSKTKERQRGGISANVDFEESLRNYLLSSMEKMCIWQGEYDAMKQHIENQIRLWMDNPHPDKASKLDGFSYSPNHIQDQIYGCTTMSETVTYIPLEFSYYTSVHDLRRQTINNLVNSMAGVLIYGLDNKTEELKQRVHSGQMTSFLYLHREPLKDELLSQPYILELRKKPADVRLRVMKCYIDRTEGHLIKSKYGENWVEEVKNRVRVYKERIEKQNTEMDTHKRMILKRIEAAVNESNAYWDSLASEIERA